MTVNATDADDAVNVNNGIIGYSILSEEPQSAQRMFTIDPEKGIISVIGTGLDREVGPRPCCVLGDHAAAPWWHSPRGTGDAVALGSGCFGDLLSQDPCPLPWGCQQPQPRRGLALGTLWGPSPAEPQERVHRSRSSRGGDIGKCLCRCDRPDGARVQAPWRRGTRRSPSRL